MILCDLCRRAKKGQTREIEGREYDICSECWKPFAQKLKGKGREIREREMVFLPPLTITPQPKETKPLPGEPPKIWGRAGIPQ
jgi:hypothetical protein